MSLFSCLFIVLLYFISEMEKFEQGDDYRLGRSGFFIGGACSKYSDNYQGFTLK